MKNFLYTCCAILGLISLTNCTKETVADPDKEQTQENSELTATIEDVTTKTQLDGVKVKWMKDDEIAVQLSRRHKENSSTQKGYVNTFAIYTLSDEAIGTKTGKFSFNSENEKSHPDEMIQEDDEFFAFYPASFCSCPESNGYFYFEFPRTQKYEDVIGNKFPLPMWGVGKNKKIEFKYAGSVIKLKVWSSEQNTTIHSCVISADGGLSKKAFTYMKDGKWPGLSPSYNVNYLTVEMTNPIELSTDETNPTEIPIVIPLAGGRTLTNLKFSINCTKNGKLAGSELTKKSPLTITPGTIVNFPVKEIKLDYTRMHIDGVEGEFDIAEISKAKESFKLSNIKLSEATFKDIINATKSLDHQIIVDLSEAETVDKFNTIKGLNGNTYEGFCGGQTKDSGIKNISELRLPKGILQINNMAFSNSDYKKIVLPATLTKIAGMPASGCDGLIWEVAEGNKIFWTDKFGALYGKIEVTNKDNTKRTFKTLIALNGGSGKTYRIQEGTEQIGAYSMYYNSVLTTLALPQSIKKIGENGLGMTPSLTTIIVYGMPIFNPSTGSNTVGKPKDEKTLYVEDEQQYNTYMQRIKEYNEKYKIDLLTKNNWKIAKLNDYKGTIPAENPAPGQGNQN